MGAYRPLSFARRLRSITAKPEHGRRAEVRRRTFAASPTHLSSSPLSCAARCFCRRAAFGGFSSFFLVRVAMLLCKKVNADALAWVGVGCHDSVAVNGIHIISRRLFNAFDGSGYIQCQLFNGSGDSEFGSFVALGCTCRLVSSVCSDFILLGRLVTAQHIKSGSF